LVACARAALPPEIDLTRSPTLRFLLSLLAPGGVLVLAAWSLLRDDAIRAAAEPYAVYFCFGALATAVLLSWYYEQSRLLCSSAAVMLTVTALQLRPNAPQIAKLAALLLPLNFIVFASLSERGLLTRRGLIEAGLVVAQAFGVVKLATTQAETVNAFLLVEPHGALPWLPNSSVISFAVGIAVLVPLVLVRRTKVEQGLLWTLVAVFLGLYGMEDHQGVYVYCGAAGLILVLSVLEHGYDIAYRDELTGLPGRRAFNQLMEHLGGGYSIAMCDVDHFKMLNDTHGHETGDQLLKMVAGRLSQVAGGGRAFRYGGEEFLVVFRGRTAKEAEPFADSLRNAVAGIRLKPRGSDAAISLTISIGIGERSTRHSTPELVLDAADAALYRAKEAGRNCVRLEEGTQAA
jgi:diguanylate cyclase (GGDEF)-like protein